MTPEEEKEFDKAFPRFKNRAFTEDTADILKSWISSKKKEWQEEGFWKGEMEGKFAGIKFGHQQAIQDCIKEIDKKKESWAMGLAYMVDEKIEDPIRVAEVHLDIIIDDFKSQLTKLIK
jgi:hypothetical protein